MELLMSGKQLSMQVKLLDTTQIGQLFGLVLLPNQTKLNFYQVRVRSENQTEPEPEQDWKYVRVQVRVQFFYCVQFGSSSVWKFMNMFEFDRISSQLNILLSLVD